jgi:ATP-dependent Clp protease ATP-binding subunit ClpC
MTMPAPPVKPSQSSLPLVSTVAAPSPHTHGSRARRGKAATNAAAPAAQPDANERFMLDPKRFPVLAALGKNLTLAAARGELDPVVCRDEEIERTLDVLAKRQGNNPCLVGPAGVGKTSVARGIALRIAAGKDVVSLDDRIVIEIEPSALLAGTAARGSLAERIVQIKTELRGAPGRVVLFFDEIHTLFSADASDEGVTELKMALAKGEICCIGATTREEYKAAIESDAALARRFSVIEVEEPSPEEAFLAIEAVAPILSGHHHTRYAEQALLASVTWSVRYIPGRALPDKAIGILDLAGARARRRSVDEVSAEHVAEVVSELAGVPMERLLESDGERMLRLESLLASRIVGHGAALGRIAAVLRRNASGFRSRRPIGSFLLLGPTGVGKTETAKAIAECLFYSPDAMTRLDLSEYSEPHAIARLVGAPPGYVGHEAGGQLTEAVRRRPYQVILLDEIEKAHRDVLEGFLQVFDEGRMTDGRGRTIDFTNTVILLTSNLGADGLRDKANTKGKIGFGGSRPTDAEDAADHEKILISAARAALPPELYNRLDEVLAFAPLGRVDVAEVARRMLAGLALDLEGARGVKLDVSEAAIEALLDEGGYDPELGARPMRRAIARLVEAPIAEMILRGEVRRGDVATVDVENGKLVVDAVTPAARPRSR